MCPVYRIIYSLHMCEEGERSIRCMDTDPLVHKIISGV